jgi:hypothetical protein
VTQQINLYNPAFLRRNPALEPGALLVYGVALVLMISAGMTVFVHSARSEAARELAEVEQKIKAEQATAASLVAQKATRRKNPALDAEATRVEGRAAAGEESLDYIRSGALGSAQGFSPTMRALARQSVEGVWLTGFSIGAGGAEVVLRGRMLDADLLPRYLARLGQDKGFEGRRFDSLSIGGPASAAGADARAPQVGFEIAARPAGPGRPMAEGK